jgi:hypothetical protein
VRGRLHTEHTAEWSVLQIWPSRVSRCESLKSKLEGEVLTDEESSDDAESMGLGERGGG